MAVARRVYLYGIALVALGMLVAGLDELVNLALDLVAEAAVGPFAGIDDDSARGRVSYAGALVGIGLVGWLIHWWLAERPVRRGDDLERRSGVRKLFLYLVLFVGGLMLTFNGRQLLADLLDAAFGQLRPSDLVGGDVIPPLAIMLAAGPFWVYYARVAARDRARVPEAGAGATLRRWCVYGLAFVGLLMLQLGAANLVRLLWDAATPASVATVATGNWLATAVAGRAASVLAGLGLWYVAWTWSTARFWRDDGPGPERDSVLRKVYLYGVLLIAVAWTVWSLGQALYVILRSLLIPAEAAGLLSSLSRDVASTAANGLVFGLTWLYHARVVEREAAAVPERERQATIRRIYGYLVAFVGALTFAVGLGGTLATVLDLIARPGGVRPEHWWAERLSLFGTLIVVGLPVWLAFWVRLQREAASAEARRSLARRIYLFLAFGLSVLALLGSGAFTLYQLLQVILGEPWTGIQTGDLIDAGSVAAVAGLFLAYHLRVFRADAADAAQEVASPALVAVLVIRAADPAALDALERELRERAPDGLEVARAELGPKAAGRLLRTEEGGRLRGEPNHSA